MTAAGALSEDVAKALNEIASAGDGCGCRSQLLHLMSEDAPIYRGKGTPEVERLRAVIAVKLAGAGLADALIPYAVEELETGTTAYSIAGAARVVRAASVRPPNIAELIIGAIDRIRSLDEFVEFDGCQGIAAVGAKTAVEEALEALAISGPQERAAIEAIGSAAKRPVAQDVGCCIQDSGCSADVAQPAQAVSASCCGGGREAAVTYETHSRASSVASLHAIELQNQDGICASFSDIFAGRPGLIAFFYTRCMNPEKCSRTISQLGEVQRIIGSAAPDSPAMLAGITYDPQYDLPERLYRYGAERGLAFDEHCQLLRATGSFDPIRDALDLGVGYGSSTVNRHRIELFLIDRAGAIVHSRLRRLWQAQEVADLLLAA